MAQEYVIMPAADYQAACDTIRAKTGGIEPIKSGDMASEIESIRDPGVMGITAISSNGRYEAADDGFDGYATVIVNVPTGGSSSLPQFTQTGATKADVLANRQFVDEFGNLQTGTMPTAEQATPAISVDTNGEITATATQDKGYVVEGTKTATKQLTTKGAATITPGNTAQEIAAGVYLTGKQTISAVPTQTKTVTSNGTVTPDAGKYLSSVVVNVPTGGTSSGGNAELGSKTITQNGEYKATDDSLDGYSSVTVNVQPTLRSLITVTPDDTQQVIDPTEDGWDGVRKVVVQPVPTQEKTVTANGEVTPDSGKFLSKVTVNVPSSGGTGANIGTVWVTPSSNTTTVTFTDVPGEPKMFAVYAVNAVSVNNTTVYATSIVYNGESVSGVTVTRAGSYMSYTANWAQTSDYTWQYSDGALTITSGSATTGGNFRSSCTYRLTYVV